MRISDWSSDVCSSDLTHVGGFRWRGTQRPLLCSELCRLQPIAGRWLARTDPGKRTADRRNSRLCETVPRKRCRPCALLPLGRSEERRVGEEWVSPCSSGGLPFIVNKKQGYNKI